MGMPRKVKSSEPQMTAQTLRILAVLLDDPAAPRYGLELAAEAELKTGTIYPILARLERAHWLQSYWENIDPVAAGRPRRRLYELTGQGLAFAREAVEAHLRQMNRPVSTATPHPGVATA